MSDYLELLAAKVIIAKSGLEGTKGLHPIVANKIVTSANMKVGTYTIAAQPVVPSLLSITVTKVDTADTMGTIAFVGTDLNGTAISETVIPVADSTVHTTKEFATVTSATGAGWVKGGTTEDTIVIGTSGIIAPTGYYFSSLIVVSAAVVASQTDVAGYVAALLSTYTSIPAGTYPIKCTAIALTSGQAIVTLATK